MISAARVLVLTAFGLVLLSGCGSEGSDAAVDTPSTPAATTGSSEDPPDEDPVSITLYDADFTVAASGDLSVVETLTLDVPVDDRHGIFRTFDLEVPVEGFTATLDGNPTPVDDSAENGETVFKVGDPERTLAVGEHSVRLEYVVPDVLTHGSAGTTQLDWLLVPAGWTMGILAADLSVDLPADAAEAHCTIGDAGPCDVDGIGTGTLVVTTGELAVHTPVRLQVQLTPAGSP